jgi:hypothetical protein
MLDFLAYLFGELLLTGVFYWPGWLVLRLLSLGRYPPPQGKHDRQLVAGCGLATMIVTLGFIYS